MDMRLWHPWTSTEGKIGDGIPLQRLVTARPTARHHLRCTILSPNPQFMGLAIWHPHHRPEGTCCLR